MQFEKKIYKNGGTNYLPMPIDLVRYLELNDDDTIIIQVETNKRGQKYISAWKKGT